MEETSDMRILAIALSTVAAALPFVADAQQIFKCIDAGTGHVTYSTTRCTATGSVSTIDVDVESTTVDTSHLRRELERSQQQQQAMPRPAPRQSYNDAPRAEAQASRDQYCREIAKPIPGARGMTAAQLDALAACAGLAASDQPTGIASSPPAAIPAPPPAPSVITNCDASGCWDNMGGRYNKGAGSTYFPASGGGACQMIGGHMHCP